MALIVIGYPFGLPAELVAAAAVLPAGLLCGYRIIVSTMPRTATLAGVGRGRGIRLLGGGVLVATVSTSIGCLVAFIRPGAAVFGVPEGSAILLIGLACCDCAYLIGLALMPGPPLRRIDRLRRALDGATMVCCGFYIAWMQLLSCDGMHLSSTMAILMSCLTFGGMTVAGLRSAAGRSAARACGAGIALCIAGITQLVVAIDYHDPVSRTYGSAVALIAGNALIFRAVAAVVRGGPTTDPLDAESDFGGYPLLAVPVVAAGINWAWRYSHGSSFNGVAIALLIGAVAVVTVRGAVSAFDARHYAERLAAKELQFRSLFSNSTDVIMVLGSELSVRWQSPAAARQLGVSDQDTVGRPFIEMVHPQDVEAASEYLIAFADGRQQPTEAIEVRLRDGFGVWRDVEMRIVDRRDVPVIASLVVYLRDISERRQLQRRLHRAAMVDGLTGLANRRELARCIDEDPAERVLVVLGLDGVTEITEQRGHGSGDTVLLEAARRIRAAIDPDDLAAKLDGDRFAVLTAAGAVQAQFLATTLLTVLAEPYSLPDGVAHLCVVAGLAETEQRGDGHYGGSADDDQGRLEGEEVLRRAELATRRADRWDSVDAVAWYDEAVESGLRRQFSIEQALPALLTGGETSLSFQPIVDLVEQRPVGVEALLRWRHPTLGIIGANEFMASAERLGMAAEICDWALHRACRAWAGWLREGYDVWLSIDVGAERLADPGFLMSVSGAMETYRVPANRLVLELGEPGLGAPRSAMARHRAVPDRAADAKAEAITGRLTELRSLGIRVALDHVGSVTMPLSRLRMMPIDMLKVDRLRFDQIPRQGGHPGVGRGASAVDTGSAGAAGETPGIVEVVTRLGGQLGLQVIAEGLDGAYDAELAREAGCRYGQGDLFCRALPAEHLEAYLDSHRTSRF